MKPQVVMKPENRMREEIRPGARNPVMEIAYNYSILTKY
jgi:hypothetical protein